MQPLWRWKMIAIPCWTGSNHTIPTEWKFYFQISTNFCAAPLIIYVCHGIFPVNYLFPSVMCVCADADAWCAVDSVPFGYANVFSIHFTYVKRFYFLWRYFLFGMPFLICFHSFWVWNSSLKMFIFHTPFHFIFFLSLLAWQKGK